MASLRTKGNSAIKLDMNYLLDSKKTFEIIEGMKLAHIGENKKWEIILKKIKAEKALSPSELGYFTNFTRIYKNLGVGGRSKNYHMRLSEHDVKPSCKICGNESQFYCNMNDQYFCINHVVGHDKNEF